MTDETDEPKRWRWFVANDPFEAVAGLNGSFVRASEAVVGSPFNQQVFIFWYGSFSTAADVPPLSGAAAFPSGGYVTIDESQLEREADLAEALELKRRIAETNESKVWRWMGNVGHPSSPIQTLDGAVKLANEPPAQGAGEAMFYLQNNLLAISVFLFY